MHAYDDDEEQLSFLKNCASSHIQFSQKVLKKSFVLGEFNKSTKDKGYSPSKRDASATGLGLFSGALFWQLLGQGMDNLRYGYDVFLAESPSAANIIFQHSRKLSALQAQ
ncbi:mannan endo-1,4-beta-mannosidase 7-like [Aristolochia californica]|uniref:mannan endo-1,4-beta-mannosidase 7-like n=1 Tax=Aristolochia californica TaxID=171875 RepID=UPI0035DBED51